MELTFGATPIKDFAGEEAEIVEGRDVVIGGMVVDFQQRQGKKGPFGILKMEDLSGSTELRLFGKTFADFNGYCTPGQQIMVTGKYQRRYQQEELHFNITNISLLSDIRGRHIRGIAIKLAVDQVDDTLCSLLRDFAANTGDGTERGELNVVIYDPKLNRSVTLNSGVRIQLNRHLIQVLESQEIEFSVLKH
jgi:DNA polymerase-3 subunit alpha